MLRLDFTSISRTAKICIGQGNEVRMAKLPIRLDYVKVQLFAVKHKIIGFQRPMPYVWKKSIAGAIGDVK
jgi:hypothetical protein